MTSAAKITTVTFDMDDTLYSERDYVRSGYAAVAQYLSERHTIDAEQISSWMWQRFISGRAARMFNALGEHFKLELSDDDISQLVQIYRQHTPQISPHADMFELLEKLKSADKKLALLSDGFLPAQQYKLDALGVADFFDAVVFTEQLGREFWKPSPVGFEKIATRLASPHESCAYIGDNPSKDFVAPNALGWLSVQFKRDGQIHAAKPAPPAGEAQLITDSIANLAAALGV